MKFSAITICSLMILSGCASKKPVNAPQEAESAMVVSAPSVASNAVRALPKAVIYKTRKDYSNLVPITLDASKTKILSYPAPTDLANARPTQLTGGYLLDNRGIGVNSVFTKYTYDEYSALPSAPSTDELLASIVDYDPFEAIYVTDAPRSSSNGTDYYNNLINSGFADCEKIK